MTEEIPSRSTEAHKWAREGKTAQPWCSRCGEHKVQVEARGDRLDAHHIKPYAGHPELRYDPRNREILCSRCHKLRHRGDTYVIRPIKYRRRLFTGLLFLFVTFWWALALTAAGLVLCCTIIGLPLGIPLMMAGCGPFLSAITYTLKKVQK